MVDFQPVSVHVTHFIKDMFPLFLLDTVRRLDIQCSLGLDHLEHLKCAKSVAQTEGGAPGARPPLLKTPYSES